MAETKQVAVVVGVGPGLGAALARRFAQKYAVAIIARKADYLRSLAGEIKTAGGHVLEVPPCMPIYIGTSEVLGIARPNWQFQPATELSRRGCVGEGT